MAVITGIERSQRDQAAAAQDGGAIKAFGLQEYPPPRLQDFASGSGKAV